jgi:hypothetical protein
MRKTKTTPRTATKPQPLTQTELATIVGGVTVDGIGTSPA